MPKISVITVCFNEQEDIRETCNSVASQIYDDYEWIVIDGGSTDNTVKIINEYKDYVTRLVSEKDSGVYDAMNKGIRLAKGEYLLFLNGGDSLYSGDVLERIFGKNKVNADVLYGNCCVLNSDRSRTILDFPKNLRKEYFIDSNINHQSTFIKNKLFDKYGDYDNKYKILADYEKWLCFIHNGIGFEKLSMVVANFKGFDGLSSQERTKDLTKKEKIMIIRKYFSLFEIIKYRVNFFLKILSSRVNFMIFSPIKFFKKYLNVIIQGRLRRFIRRFIA